MSISQTILFDNYPQLKGMAAELDAALSMLVNLFRADGTLLLCGNGGSAADCDHIAGELLKGFLGRRPLNAELRTALSETAGMREGPVMGERLQQGLAAVPLPAITAGRSAFANDVDPLLDYAQLVVALGRPGDILWAISTSGNSRNVVNAAMTARAKGMGVLAMTGDSGGQLKHFADVLLAVPESETYRVQELHLPVYHYLCAGVEDALFG